MYWRTALCRCEREFVVTALALDCNKSGNTILVSAAGVQSMGEGVQGPFGCDFGVLDVSKKF